MNIFVALFTLVGFALTTGVWFIGAYTIFTKVRPFVMDRINKSEEDSEIDLW
jgi:predicted membrane protein